MWSPLVYLFSILISFTQAFQVYYGPPQEADLQERPFQAAIIKNDAYTCSAALISTKCVITACSCIIDDTVNLDTTSKVPDNYTLLTYTRYIRAEQINWAYATDVFIADGCNTQSNLNDAAVLCSSEDLVGFPVTIVKEATKTNVRGIVSGWGLSVKGQDVIQPHLQRAYMRIISLDECRRLYAGVRDVPDSALCAVATDEVQGFCAGDIGAPLTHGEGLIGIGVAKFGCGPKKYPGIFTNVSMISGYIDNAIQEHQTLAELHYNKEQ